MRSLPEKTIEHWLSLYVGNRFPRSALWWPTHGHDISVEDLAGHPGKAVLIEVKTAEWEPRWARHRVAIDVDQLRAYLRQGLPVYYAFPVPQWPGVLQTTTPWLGGIPRSDLAYRRARGIWFGNWMVVTTARAVLAALAPTPNQRSATLFTHPGQPASSVTQVLPSLGVAWIWSDFWTRLAACGSQDMPSMIVAPTSGERLPRSMPRAVLASTLREWAADEGGVGVDRYPTSLYLPWHEDDDLYHEVSGGIMSEQLATLSPWVRHTALLWLSSSDITSQ